MKPIKLHFAATAAGVVEVPSSQGHRLYEITALNTGDADMYLWLLDHTAHGYADADPETDDPISAAATIAAAKPCSICAKIPAGQQASFASAKGYPFSESIFIGLNSGGDPTQSFGAGAAGTGLITALISQQPG